MMAGSVLGSFTSPIYIFIMVTDEIGLLDLTHLGLGEVIVCGNHHKPVVLEKLSERNIDHQYLDDNLGHLGIDSVKKLIEQRMEEL